MAKTKDVVVNDKYILRRIKKIDESTLKMFLKHLDDIQYFNKLMSNINDLNLLKYCIADVIFKRDYTFEWEVVWLNAFYIKEYGYDLLSLYDMGHFKCNLHTDVGKNQYIKTMYTENKDFNCYVCYVVYRDDDNQVCIEPLHSSKSLELIKETTKLYHQYFTDKDYLKLTKIITPKDLVENSQKITDLFGIFIDLVCKKVTHIDRKDLYSNKLKGVDFNAYDFGFISQKEIDICKERIDILKELKKKIGTIDEYIVGDFEHSIIVKSLFIKLHRFIVTFCAKPVREKNILKLEEYYQTSYEIQKGDDIFDIAYFNYFGYKIFGKELFTPDQLFLLSLKKLFDVSEDKLLAVRIIEDSEFECYSIRINYLYGDQEKKEVHIKMVNLFAHHDLDLISLIALKIQYMLDHNVFNKYKDLKNKTYQELLLDKQASKLTKEFYKSISHLVNYEDFINSLIYNINESCYLDKYKEAYDLFNAQNKNNAKKS